MGTTISPSDFTEINPSYTNGRGYYTNATEVANLLQIPPFSGTTYPTTEQVGAIIKRVEGSIEELNKINLTNLSLEEVDIFNKSISKLKEIQ